MKQSILDFIAPIPVGNLKTQFALEGTAIDTDNYYTGFHNGQDRFGRGRAGDKALFLGTPF